MVANRSRHVSEETRAKMSAAHKGRVFTPEWRAKISEAKKEKVMNLDPVTKFMERVKQMQTGRSKEMRMSYEEAQALALTIAQLLVEDVKKVEKDDGKVIITGGPLKPTQGK